MSFANPILQWCYYLLIILNGLTALAYFLFYFPPNFHAKHAGISKWELVKDFDYVGTFLYLAGLLLLVESLF